MKPAGLETLLLHADRAANPTTGVVSPIFQTATFVAATPEDLAERSACAMQPEFYTRCHNPNSAQVEQVLARLEGAEAAMLVGSGMGAISATILSMVRQGAHVVAQASHYGGTMTFLRDVLPRFGVAVTQVDQADVEAFARALQPNTRLILLETPSNPILRLTDLTAVVSLARARHVLTVADNTFASPVNQRPLDLGVDVVVHSATKYLGGHSDVVAGAVVGRRALIEEIWSTQILLGAAVSPFDAWLILRGLRTLAVRVQRQNENALALAEFLESHPAVSRVYYPGLKSHPQYELARRQMAGFGGVLSFEVRGGAPQARVVLGRLRLPRFAPSLGGVESLVVLPAAMFAHYMSGEESEQAGIPQDLIRVSVGLETLADLVADFDQALAE